MSTAGRKEVSRISYAQAAGTFAKKHEAKLPVIEKATMLRFMEMIWNELDAEAFALSAKPKYMEEYRQPLYKAAKLLRNRIHQLQNSTSYENKSPYKEFYWLKNFDQALTLIIPSRDILRETIPDFIDPILGEENLNKHLAEHVKKSLLNLLKNTNGLPSYAVDVPSAKELSRTIQEMPLVEAEEIEQEMDALIESSGPKR